MWHIVDSWQMLLLFFSQPYSIFSCIRSERGIRFSICSNVSLYFRCYHILIALACQISSVMFIVKVAIFKNWFFLKTLIYLRARESVCVWDWGRGWRRAILKQTAYWMWSGSWGLISGPMRSWPEVRLRVRCLTNKLIFESTLGMLCKITVFKQKLLIWDPWVVFRRSMYPFPPALYDKLS